MITASSKRSLQEQFMMYAPVKWSAVLVTTVQLYCASIAQSKQPKLEPVTIFWYLLHMRAVKAYVRLHSLNIAFTACTHKIGMKIKTQIKCEDLAPLDSVVCILYD